ncbi:hypothetical protein [Paraferrimonas sp. SM1919]|uniref:hypothetical protein n=1 Tax=Paraferrimonas sp. SM1919 TaxID=2662263 RepID=UPI0013D47385|nr:hypothetical protein [Paraferrimonas sp. SM1919]
MKIKTIISLILLASLGACSTTAQKPSKKLIELPFIPVQNFHTQVLDNGAKLFFLSIENPVSASIKTTGKSIVIDKRRTVHQIKQQLGYVDPEYLQSALMQRLHMRLDRIDYCQAGYLILNKITSSSYAEIRGECHDGASIEQISELRNHYTHKK